MAVDPHNIGIQMKQKELTKPFIMIPNAKKPLVLMFYKKDLRLTRRKHVLVTFPGDVFSTSDLRFS